MSELYCSHLSSLKMWKQQSTQILREGLQGSILGCTVRKWLENCWAGFLWSHVEEKRERRRWYFSWSMSLTSFACCVLSHFSCVQLFEAQWTVACQAPLIHEIFQARILEWVAISSSGGSFWPRDPTTSLVLAGRFFTTEPPEKP